MGAKPNEILLRRGKSIVSEPIDILLQQVVWKEIPREERDIDPDIPFATDEGVLDLGEVKLKVYRLSNGMRVFDVDDIENLFKQGIS